jgi:hypothetical protein
MALGRLEWAHRDLAERVISDCRFRKTATESVRKFGIKLSSCTSTTRRQSDITLLAGQRWDDALDYLSAAPSVRARPGCLSALSILRSKSVFCGAFVRARRALSISKLRFPARAEARCRPRPRRRAVPCPVRRGVDARPRPAPRGAAQPTQPSPAQPNPAQPNPTSP